MKTWVVLLGFAAALAVACGSRPQPLPPTPPLTVAGSAARLSAGGGVLRGGNFVMQVELGGAAQPALGGGGFTLEAAGILER